METNKLNDREELILNAVVHSYITTAEPVGSRTVVKRFDLDISPATVRNVMADLEDLGFLEQRHTSSGRVPTDRGYRYYVDYLMHVQKVTQAERNRLERELMEKVNDADEVLRQTSQLLALLSHHAGIVEGPSLNEATVHHIEVMPLGGDRVVVLLADNYGRVRTRAMQLDETLSLDTAERLGRFLNDHLKGVTIEEVGPTLTQQLANYVDEQRLLAQKALQVLEVTPQVSTGVLFLYGATQLFEQPEFRDIDRAREVFGLLEERDRVLALLRTGIDPSDTAPHVVIGSEANRWGLNEISVVSAPYQVGGRTVGHLGVLGPRRMQYSKLAGVVQYTAGVVGKLLSRLAS